MPLMGSYQAERCLCRTTVGDISQGQEDKGEPYVYPISDQIRQTTIREPYLSSKQQLTVGLISDREVVIGEA